MRRPTPRMPQCGLSWALLSISIDWRLMEETCGSAGLPRCGSQQFGSSVFTGKGASQCRSRPVGLMSSNLGLLPHPEACDGDPASHSRRALKPRPFIRITYHGYTTSSWMAPWS